MQHCCTDKIIQSSNLVKIHKLHFDLVLNLNIMAGHTFCTMEVQTTIGLLREVYEDSMNKVLYIGPDTCSVMSELFLDEDDYESWGLEPYDPDAIDSYCWDLIPKGIVRVADMRFRLPYGEKSFSHVIVSDTLEYMSSGYLNNTIPEFMRLARHGVIIFAGKSLFTVLFYRHSKRFKLRVHYIIISDAQHGSYMLCCCTFQFFSLFILFRCRLSRF